MTSQRIRQALAPQRFRASRVVPSPDQRNASLPLKSRAQSIDEPRLDSLLPDATQGSKTRTASVNNLDLPLRSAVVLPAIDDAYARTPPAWKRPWVDENESPKEALRLPLAVNTSVSTCDSPTKTPGRVAKVFKELLPVTPRRTLQKKKTTELQRQKSRENLKHRRNDMVGHGLRVMRNVGTAMGLRRRKKVPKHNSRSLAELRRHFVQRHRSLAKAFREMEDHLKECQREEGAAWKKSNIADDLHTKMMLADFTKAIAIFGVDSEEALHFFKLMDHNGDGYVTFEEFKCALVNFPPELLLQDFRKRLLTAYSSTHEAFTDLFCIDDNWGYEYSERPKTFTRKAFAVHLARIGIEEQDSSLLFDIFDANASGTVFIDQLQEKMREVAPSVSVEEFWQRFNSRWPHIREMASNVPEGRRLAAESLFKILPAKFRGTSLELPLTLPADAWESLCKQLDVSQRNGAELFTQCATAKVWQGQQTLQPRHPPSTQVKLRLPVFAEYLEELREQCDLDDFFDELLLWSQTPLARQGAGKPKSYGTDMAQRFGFIKTQVVAA